MATISNSTPVEDQKETSKEKLQSSGDILCDSCMDSPSPALKSCLTCLVSYCEHHLRPHLENVKFQNHRLVEPLHYIDCHTCDVHRLPLDRFCMKDESSLCRDCEREVHDGHKTASVMEARAQIEVELQEKQAEIRQSVSEAEKAIGKLQGNKDTVKTFVHEISVAIEQQFSILQINVEEAKKAAIEVLDKEQKQALRQSESIEEHLQQRSIELTKILTNVNKLQRAKSDIDFLQKYSEWKKTSTDLSLPSVHIKGMEHLSSYVQIVMDTTQELCGLVLSSYKEKMDIVFKSGTKSKSQSPEPAPLPVPVTRDDFLKYQKSLTFDQDTIHNFLRVTEDNRKLTNTSPWQHSYLDHPSRFEYWRQALTSESLYLGRHYIEAEVRGEGAHFGVTYKSIDPKGEQSTSCIGQSEYSWCFGRNSKCVSVWHAGVETPLEVSGVTTVGLYIDFHQGSVSFYDVYDNMKLLHSYDIHLLEPLYVIAWLSKKDNTIMLLDMK